MSNPLVSVVIPTWNGRHLLEPCLVSLRAQSYHPLEILVVDGGSEDGTVEWLRSDYPEITTLALPFNRGFTGNVNAGIRASGGEHVCLLNNDAAAEPDWIAAIAEAMRVDSRMGAVASKMVSFDAARIDSAGDCLGRDGLAWQRGAGELDHGQYDAPASVFSACGGAAAYRRTMLRDVGLLDEGFGSYLEDVDLGLRARLRGWDCCYVPEARVRHRGSATGGGPLASYHVARNSVRLIARGFPARVIRVSLGRMLQAQGRRAIAAARAWRGAAARATLRGMIAGLAMVPLTLRERRTIQQRKLISDQAFLDLLEDAAPASPR